MPCGDVKEPNTDDPPPKPLADAEPKGDVPEPDTEETDPNPGVLVPKPAAPVPKLEDPVPNAEVLVAADPEDTIPAELVPNPDELDPNAVVPPPNPLPPVPKDDPLKLDPELAVPKMGLAVPKPAEVVPLLKPLPRGVPVLPAADIVFDTDVGPVPNPDDIPKPEALMLLEPNPTF